MSEFAFAFRRQRRGLLIWAVSLALYTAMIASVWPSIKKSGKAMQDYMNSMPEGFRKAFGITEITTPAGYLGGELFSMIMPLLLIIAMIVFTVALTAGYEDAGYFETLLALPVSRAAAMLARGLAAAAALAGLGVALYLTLAAMCAAVGMHLGQDKLVAGMLCVLVLALLHGAVAYLGAGLGLGRARTVGLAAGFGVLGYAVNSLFPLSSALAGAAKYSPWHWTTGQDPLRTGLPTGGLLLTLALIAVLVAAGTVAAGRRDIHLP